MYWRQVVSQAPVKTESYGKDQAYIEGFRILHDQVDAGVSWSGHERNAAFLNLGPGDNASRVSLFADVSGAMGFDFPDDARALTTLDWDNDGDQDVIITNRTGPRVRFLRNNLNGQGQFVTFELRGKQSNRDGIGARVVVTLKKNDAQATLMRTVYAGHGFISQSSKRLHFGVDDGATISSVTVRWSNGASESIETVSANAHYRITEGSGRAELVSHSQSRMAGSGEAATPSSHSDAATVSLVDPIPLPYLRYRRGDQQLQLAAPLERPLLINLWATWCAPCVVELNDLAKHKKELEAAGVDVLALNLDDLKPSSTEAKLKSAEFLERLNFPFASGEMTPNLMRVIETAHNATFLRPHQLPIPFSLLIDQSGRIAVVYRGPIEVDRLIKDVKALNKKDSDTWTSYSQHFDGRWMAARRRTPYLPIAAKFLEENLLVEASELLMLHAEIFKHDADYAKMLMVCGTRSLQAKNLQMAGTLLKKAVEIQPTLAEAHGNLGVVYRRYGNRPSAMEHLLTAVKLSPDYVDARLNLASLLAEKQKFAEAQPHVDAVLAKQPEHRAALEFAGQLSIQLMQWERAVKIHEQIIIIAPKHVKALVNLGGAHQQLGKTDLAINYYERALKINPKLQAVQQVLSRLYLRQKVAPK